ncbi:MAG TPA: hypothetical protein EYQ50_11210 [Verrucomicrobiales bacterium]|nr:hypothetical protein [Verrucomicrobiales bacterium]
MGNRFLKIKCCMHLSAVWLVSFAVLHNVGFCYAGTPDGFPKPASAVTASVLGLRISEFMAINNNTLRDHEGRPSDWIEIHNSNSISISLSGYFLTDDPEELDKWEFPEISIPARSYLLVFASGRKVATDSLPIRNNEELHASFRLSGSGEYLALIAPDGVTAVHELSPAFPQQKADISSGFSPTATGLRYFDRPTPGSSNPIGFDGIVEDTKFSVDRGLYGSRFGVEITSANSGAVIRYTTDGSLPSPSHGNVYQRPIPIAKTTPLRAMAYRIGFLPTNVDTQTYVFPEKVARQPSQPSGYPEDWGTDGEVPGKVVADYEMDARVVDSTLEGYSVPEALADIPTLSIVMNREDFLGRQKGIYNHPKSRGSSWEKVCSLEWFNPADGGDFQVDCRIEIHGNSSRRPFRMQKHSFRISFLSELGAGKLRYALFPDSPVEKFNKLVLRACFTDSWGLVSWGAGRYRPNDSQYIRDVWMKESLRDMGQPSSYGDFTHLYINGLYWGIYNVTERLEDDFFADHQGGEEEDWEVVEDLSGGGEHWQRLMRDIREKANDPNLLELLENRLDLENFMDYMLLHFYADSEDWPHHNGYAAGAPTIGIPFRFYVWDQEIVLDNHSIQKYDRNESGKPGELFQILRRNSDFRLMFADRVYKQLSQGGALSLTNSQQRYRKWTDRIDKAIVAESARWGDVQMTTPYGNRVEQPSPLSRWDHRNYPPAPHSPNFYFTREDSWIIERDNVLNEYLPKIYDDSFGNGLLTELRRENLYPSISPPDFQLAQSSFGSEVTLELNFPPEQEVFYTINGSDPGADLSEQASLQWIRESSPVKVWIPDSNFLERKWTSSRFEDDDWISGAFGIGYEIPPRTNFSGLINFDISAMYRKNASLYIRSRFVIEDASLIDRIESLYLHIKYDDGFLAYLNGQQMASSNAPTDPIWNSRATQSRNEVNAVLFEPFDVDSGIQFLKPGLNVLAIQALNADHRSDDLLLVAKLTAELGPAENGEFQSMQYLELIRLTEPGKIRARSLAKDEWSALIEIDVGEDYFPRPSTFAGDPFEDRDEDGLPSLIEYALGTEDQDPTSGWDAISYGTSSGFPDSEGFEFRIARSLTATGIDLEIETSSDLVHWVSAKNNDQIVTEFERTDSRNSLVLKLSSTDFSHLFFRIRVVLNQ